MKRLIFTIILMLISAVHAADKRPDIILIMTDDMGYSDLGCYGGEIKTPHLDSLAANGLRYRNFYSENMCWVSRAAMLSGIYHKTSLYKSTLHPNAVTLMELLKQQGYQTRMAGKWHLGDKNNSPMHRGFEQWYGILGGASSFFHPVGLLRNNKDAAEEYKSKDYYFTDAVSDSCVNYIRDAEKDKPLFIYAAYTAAHWPLHARESDIAKYKGKYSMGWDELRIQRLKRMKELGIIDRNLALSERHSKVPAWKNETNKGWQERRMEVYAAQVTVMDEGVGRIVNALNR